MTQTELDATKIKTLTHIMLVQKTLNKMAREIIKRGEQHDASKLESPELEGYAGFTDKLMGLTYGSEEYQKCMEELKPVLEHHYANNGHHPEHYKNGLNDMNLIDIIEMFGDWYAASKRQNNGNMRTSLDHNAERFRMNPQLKKIFNNTINLLED